MDVVGGVFTSTGVSKVIPIKINFDWMETYNWTVINAQTNNAATRTYWQRGMAANDCIYTYFNAGSTAINTGTALNFPGGAMPGYTEYNSGNEIYGATNYTNLLQPIAITAISGANPGVVTTADIVTPALANGDIVRFSNTNPQVGQFGGIDFTVGAVTSTGGNAGTFTIAFGPVVVAGAGMAGFYRKLKYDSTWSPRKRYISKIRSVGVTTQITMTVTHNLLVGEIVRFHIPSVRGSAAFGMVELDNLTGTITAINTADVDGVLNTITVDINSSAFTAFQWPLTAFDRFTAPTVCPIGEDATDTFSSDTITDDKIINVASKGIILGGNTTVVSPVGAAGNVIYWKAGNFWTQNG
jgi:hypothetical protein